MHCSKLSFGSWVTGHSLTQPPANNKKGETHFEQSVKALHWEQLSAQNVHCPFIANGATSGHSLKQLVSYLYRKKYTQNISIIPVREIRMTGCTNSQTRTQAARTLTLLAFILCIILIMKFWTRNKALIYVKEISR